MPIVKSFLFRKPFLIIFGLFLLISMRVENIFGTAYSTKARTIEFSYQIQITDLPSHAADLKIWIPAASENHYQNVELETTHFSIIPKINRDKIFNNKILYYSFESLKDNVHFDVKYKIKRYERSGILSGKDNPNHEKKEDLAKYLTSNRLMVVSKEIKELAGQIVEDKASSIDKARAIYDYCLENLLYDKSIPGWGNGDTMRACSVKAGNCTDFHSLFVSLARAAGIPAKFVVGFSLPKQKKGDIYSYHCWAEFYDEGFGWVPVDVSEAWKNREKQDYYFGNLDEDRVEFTQGRDIVLEPPANAGMLNYFIYPYAELNGKPIENIRVYFRFREIPDWQGA